MRSAGRLLDAWRHTPTKWYPLPWFVGALLLVLIQYRHRSSFWGDDEDGVDAKEVHVGDDGREVVRLKGPWQVHILGALPLRNLSRLWGYLNSLELPVWFRPYGFRLYALFFSCDLSEIEPEDLRSYPSLGAFFYRALKPGARPVAEHAPLVSPADGTILHLGVVQGERVEQVKGLSYSLDALLGVPRPDSPAGQQVRFDERGKRTVDVVDDEEFANVNGIEYSLAQLIGTSAPSTPVSEHAPSQPPPPPSKLENDLERHRRHPPPKKFGDRVDASVEDDRPTLDAVADHASVARELGAESASAAILPKLTTPGGRSGGLRPRAGNKLFFAVIYLAPGDYHRFHSPVAWVVEKRRHFRGELFSVSPYVARRLENLFVLNERVALLGRWRWGAFSMIPVGATNVGSIKIDFDRDLRTNTRSPPPPPGTYEEAVYTHASAVLGGQPLSKGQEMGGFCLGSTIVLVFEAPETFEFEVRAGQKVKVGMAMGGVREKAE